MPRCGQYDAATVIVLVLFGFAIAFTQIGRLLRSSGAPSLNATSCSSIGAGALQPIGSLYRVVRSLDGYLIHQASNVPYRHTPFVSRFLTSPDQLAATTRDHTNIYLKDPDGPLTEQALLCDLPRCDVIEPVSVVVDPLVKTTADHPFYTAVTFRSLDSNVDVVPVASDVPLVCLPRNVSLVHAGPRASTSRSCATIMTGASCDAHLRRSPEAATAEADEVRVPIDRRTARRERLVTIRSQRQRCNCSTSPAINLDQLSSRSLSNIISLVWERRRMLQGADHSQPLETDPSIGDERLRSTGPECRETSWS